MLKGTIVMSVDMDDWYHAGWIAGRRKAAFTQAAVARRKYGGEGLRGPMRSILRLFKQYNVATTFFSQGEIALEYPDIVESVVAQGHEVGSHDMHHISPRIRTLDEYKRDLCESIRVLERISGQKILGYRSPNGEFLEMHVNAMEQVGLRYDASVYPCIPIPGFYGRPFAPTQPYRPSRFNLSEIDQSRRFVEFPFAVVPHLRIPGGSAWYLRNFGMGVVKLALRAQSRRGVGCFNFHPYEISNLVPRVPELPFHALRGIGDSMYRQIEALLRQFRGRCRFTSFREILEAF